MHTCTYTNRSGMTCGNEDVVHRSSFAGTMYEYACEEHFFAISSNK